MQTYVSRGCITARPYILPVGLAEKLFILYISFILSDTLRQSQYSFLFFVTRTSELSPTGIHFGR